MRAAEKLGLAASQAESIVVPPSVTTVVVESFACASAVLVV